MSVHTHKWARPCMRVDKPTRLLQHCDAWADRRPTETCLHTLPEPQSKNTQLYSSNNNVLCATRSAAGQTPQISQTLHNWPRTESACIVSLRHVVKSAGTCRWTCMLGATSHTAVTWCQLGSEPGSRANNCFNQRQQPGCCAGCAAPASAGTGAGGLYGTPWKPAWLGGAHS